MDVVVKHQLAMNYQTEWSGKKGNSQRSVYELSYNAEGVTDLTNLIRFFTDMVSMGQNHQKDPLLRKVCHVRNFRSLWRKSLWFGETKANPFGPKHNVWGKLNRA